MATTTRAARRRKSGRGDLVKLGMIALLVGFGLAVREDVAWAVAVWESLVDAYMAVVAAVGQFFADTITDGIAERQDVAG